MLDRQAARRLLAGLGRGDREPTEQITARPHGHNGQVVGSAGRVDESFEALWQLAVDTSPEPLALFVVDRRGGPGVALDPCADGLHPRPREGELVEAPVDLFRSTELHEPSLEPGLQLTALERAGHLSRDRREQADVRVAELPQVVGLHVQHTDQPVTRDDRHRAHRDEPGLIDAVQPPEARLSAHIRHHDRAPLRGRPPRDPLADLQPNAAHPRLRQAVRRGEQQPLAVRFQQVDAADVGDGRLGRLGDDAVHELAGVERRRRHQGQTLQEPQLPNRAHHGRVRQMLRQSVALERSRCDAPLDPGPPIGCRSRRGLSCTRRPRPSPAGHSRCCVVDQPHPGNPRCRSQRDLCASGQDSAPISRHLEIRPPRGWTPCGPRRRGQLARSEGGAKKLASAPSQGGHQRSTVIARFAGVTALLHVGRWFTVTVRREPLCA